MTISTIGSVKAMANTPSAKASSRAVPRIAPSPSNSSRRAGAFSWSTLSCIPAQRGVRAACSSARAKPISWPWAITIITSTTASRCAAPRRAAWKSAASNGPRCARRCSRRWPAFDKPASAYDIAEAVSKARGKRVAANSVYRILDLFVGTNLARRVESANAYVANAHPGCLHDCIFLICDTLRAGDPPRRRQIVERRARRRRQRRVRTGPPGDRSPRHLRRLQLGSQRRRA